MIIIFRIYQFLLVVFYNSFLWIETFGIRLKSKNLGFIKRFYMDTETSADDIPTMQLQASSNLPTLRFGDSGESVRVLQRLLRSNGYPINIDANFGALTESAVRAFQSRRGLVADGIVGARTWHELTR
jgi:peptidoglycan hydrolase-like protein with peptidoglycan-binding domain